MPGAPRRMLRRPPPPEASAFVLPRRTRRPAARARRRRRSRRGARPPIRQTLRSVGARSPSAARSSSCVLLLFGHPRLPGVAEGAAFKDYVRDVGALVSRVRTSRATACSTCSRPGGASEVDFQQQRQRLPRRVGRAARRPRQGHRPPGRARQRARATWSRRSSSAATASTRSPARLAAALGRRGRRARPRRQIAAQMQYFRHERRHLPQRRRTRGSTQDAEGRGVIGRAACPRAVPAGHRLARPDARWPTASPRIGRAAAAATSRPRPGLHGTGLGTVRSSGGHRARPGAPGQVRSPTTCPFEVQVANQGENDETGRGGEGHARRAAASRSSSRRRSTRSPRARPRR